MLHDTLKELKKLTNLDIPDNLTVALSDELNLHLLEDKLKNQKEMKYLYSHLGTLTLGSGPSEDLDDPREGDAGLVHAEALLCNTDNPSDPP